MLAQGFMPAQSIHIVRNPVNSMMGPWYKFSPGLKIVTPEWMFYGNRRTGGDEENLSRDASKLTSS